MERIRLYYTIGVKSKEYGFHFHKESKKKLDSLAVYLPEKLKFSWIDL